MFRKFKMKNNGVTKEFYISQSGIKVSFIKFIFGEFIDSQRGQVILVLNNSFRTIILWCSRG